MDHKGLLLDRLLDFLGRADHQRRMNVGEAALRNARDRGRTRDELIADTEFSLNQVRTALRKLREQGRAEQDGDRWRMRNRARIDSTRTC
jgi:hypothetical protein